MHQSLMSTSTTRVISIPKKEHCRLLSPQSQSTTFSFTVTLAQTSTPIACLTAQKPWVIDSGATNHTIGTRGLLLIFENPISLPCVISVEAQPLLFLVWALLILPMIFLSYSQVHLTVMLL